LKKCNKLPIIAVMDENVKIMCVNDKHELIIVYFLEQIQQYVDEITEHDEDFEVFLNVLIELIAKSNENVIFSFLGAEYTEKWLSELPMTVYFAVVGYMHLIDVSLMDLIDTTEKLNNLVNETLDELQNVEDFGDSYYKINLN
tara:strand:- start:599 stop:1027 length:429 start_codon:yes stop_codon:yes gene_type:complete